MTKRMVILTEGHTDPHTAKTASCLLRYRRDEVVALLDSSAAGQTCQSLLGVGGDIPVVQALSAAPDADTLVLGIAPPGGRIPTAWREVIMEAISQGMDVIAGLHDFLTDDPEFSAAADQHRVQLSDVRKNDEGTIARRRGIRDDCLRLLTIGHDCSVGKMVTSFELTRGLNAAGHDAHFIATGQTGIMIAGGGCPIDRVVADFVSGAVEKMVLENQQHEMLVVEGQGSLVHPSYSAVTLGLLHGALPHAMILVYEVGREDVTGMDGLKIPPLKKIIELNELMAGVFAPCRVIGVSMNSRRVSENKARAERERVESELGLPVCDVVRDGPQKLIAAIEQFHRSGSWTQGKACV